MQITAAATHDRGFCVTDHSVISDKKAQFDGGVIGTLLQGTAVPMLR